MINIQTIIKIIDNTGVKKVLCIRILGSNKKFANIGDLIIGTVKETNPKSIIKKSDIVKILITRTKLTLHRNDGTKILFNENSGILLNKELNPIGTRIFGPITSEIRTKGFTKILTLANTII